MKENIKTVARINDVSIMLINGTEKLIPVKPICEALGIDHKSQMSKIQKDEILASTMVLSTTVGADGKDREMSCIPFKFVFGWLFSINPRNVKPEVKEQIIKYKLQCYDALYNYFADQGEFLELKQKALEKQLEEVERIRADYSDQKKQLSDAKKALNDIKEMTFEQWQYNKRQLSIEFPN
ncbi:phage antirepressor N-terminal domain-containing protein [Saccharicrinis aurantiacus]|uniref:phage antirepressor N-terminal domain-containing protein n=1 Tax=Saccharicrinis aurantiacus TaxID=1849719 RepID=UPI00249383D8|nr:phage antirepressor N-terminal domain-containing protein [Saccharicrinis aurantiacus]